MSHFGLNDDFFSPVRIDDSTIDESSDSSDETLNDLLNAEKSSLKDVVKNKVSLEKDMRKSAHENEMKSKDKSIIKIENACTPVLNKNSLDKSNVKKQSSILKLEKLKETKNAAMRKGNSKSQQQAQESLPEEDILNSCTPKSDITEKLYKKKSRTSSLLSKNENAKLDSLKDVEKGQKSNSQSSKHCCEGVISESRTKKSVQKKSSNSLEKSSDKKLKNHSVISSESRENMCENNSENKKSNIVSEQREKLTGNTSHASYEAAIEKMVRSSVSSEASKVRMQMYAQQMSFYREMNKIKDEMEKQHYETTERLFKVIGELMQMNASLKLGL